MTNFNDEAVSSNPFGEALYHSMERVATRIVKQEGTRMRWATVESTDPLRIRYDREDDPSSVDPIDLDGGLSIGDRVRVAWFKGQATILPRSGGQEIGRASCRERGERAAGAGH